MSATHFAICSVVRHVCRNSTHASLISASARQSQVQRRHTLQYAAALGKFCFSHMFSICLTMPRGPCSCVLENASTSAAAGALSLPAWSPKWQLPHTRIVSDLADARRSFPPARRSSTFQNYATFRIVALERHREPNFTTFRIVARAGLRFLL